MASRVITDGYLLLNSVDLSTELVGIDENFTTDVADDTGMGVTDKEYAIELDDADFSLDFKGEFGAGSVEATLWAIRTGRAAVAMIVGSDGSAASASNPVYTVSAILKSWGPISGAAGRKAGIRAQLQVTGGVTRATS